MNLTRDDLKFLVALPLAGAVVGAVVTWMLAQLSTWRGRRREDRKPLGRALAHLLQVHWFMFMYEVARSAGTVTDSEVMKKLIRDMKFAAPVAMPKPEELEKSYADAIERISEVAPTLAFELRDKVHIRGLYAQLGERVSGKTGAESDLVDVFGDIAMNRFLPSFEKTILEVAKRFGRREHREIKAHFQKLRQRIENAPSIMRAQLQQAQQAKSSPAAPVR